MARTHKNQSSKQLLQGLANQSASEILKKADFTTDTDSIDSPDYDDLYDEDDQMERINNSIRKKLKRNGY